MSNVFDNSHFAFIPKWMQEKLTMKSLLFKDAPWFKEAWEKYADICKSLPRKQIPDPDEFFEEAEKVYKGKEWYAVPKEDDGVKFSEDEDSADILKAAEDLEEVSTSEQNSKGNKQSRKLDLEINKRTVQKRR